MFYHPSHFLRRAVGGSNDEVAFVLPVFIIHNNQELAASECRQGVLHRVAAEFARVTVCGFETGR